MNVPHCFFVDYPTEKKMLERLICTAAQNTWNNEIRNPKVYIYRATSVMLTSLCVSFWKPPWAFVATFFQLKTVWGAGAQFPDSVHWEDKLYDALLLRWCSGGWVWRNGTRESAGLWVLCRAVCPFLLSIPTSWVCIVWAAVRLAGILQASSDTHTHTHAQSCIHARNKHSSTAADMRGVGFLKHWHFPVTAGLEGMVAADCCWCCSCCLWFSRAEYRK